MANKCMYVHMLTSGQEPWGDGAYSPDPLSSPSLETPAMPIVSTQVREIEPYCSSTRQLKVCMYILKIKSFRFLLMYIHIRK